MQSVDFGYIRVSTKEQNEKRQLAQLKTAGVENRNIIIDKESGKDFNRKEYQRLVQHTLREGDRLIICSIDRLGRNYDEIRREWEYITQTVKANIKVLDIPLLDTSTATQDLDKRFMADLILQVLRYVAEKERINIKRRQREGIDAMQIIDGKRVSAKTNRPIGRPKAEYPENWESVYSEWKDKKITAKYAMQQLELKPNTFYKLASEYTEKQAV